MNHNKTESVVVKDLYGIPITINLNDIREIKEIFQNVIRILIEEKWSFRISYLRQYFMAAFNHVQRMCYQNNKINLN